MKFLPPSLNEYFCNSPFWIWVRSFRYLGAKNTPLRELRKWFMPDCYYTQPRPDLHRDPENIELFYVQIFSGGTNYDLIVFVKRYRPFDYITSDEFLSAQPVQANDNCYHIELSNEGLTLILRELNKERVVCLKTPFMY
jgi:hypothetical protein